MEFLKNIIDNLASLVKRNITLMKIKATCGLSLQSVLKVFQGFIVGVSVCITVYTYIHTYQMHTPTYAIFASSANCSEAQANKAPCLSLLTEYIV